MHTLKIIRTGDGSDSILAGEFDETYHSIHGAITESRHVFIKNGFRFLVSEKNPEELAILEMGLGTGLHVLLTWLENRKYNLRIHYTAIEAYPLPTDLARNLNYTGELPGADNSSFFNTIHDSPWNEFVEMVNGFYLRKINARYEDFHPSGECFDLIYYDAFSPGKQPELWEIPILRKTAECMCPSGVLVTYTAKGQLKRDLRSIGLTVETLQGPPGKKEMIRAISPSRLP